MSTVICPSCKRTVSCVVELNDASRGDWVCIDCFDKRQMKLIYPKCIAPVDDRRFLVPEGMLEDAMDAWFDEDNFSVRSFNRSNLELSLEAALRWLDRHPSIRVNELALEATRERNPPGSTVV